MNVYTTKDDNTGQTILRAKVLVIERIYMKMIQRDAHKTAQSLGFHHCISEIDF